MIDYNSEVALYLARTLSRLDIDVFQSCARQLAKELGQVPSAHMVALRMLDQDEQHALKHDQMGYYCISVSGRSRVWLAEKNYERALRYMLRTLFLHANGPQNVGIQQSHRSGYIEWCAKLGHEPVGTLAFFHDPMCDTPAAGIVDRCCRALKTMDQGVEMLDQMWWQEAAQENEKLRRFALWRKPDVAWAMIRPALVAHLPFSGRFRGPQKQAPTVRLS